jgi:hypothetical protein
MKKKMYLPLYEEWMKTGKLPAYGLCYSFGDIDGNKYYQIQHELLSIFEPQEFEEYPYIKEDYVWRCFWAADGETNGRNHMSEFTPLRQNIVLFMAAMNNEL